MIVFEGIDGSGKSSVIEELQRLIKGIIIHDLPVPTGSVLSFIKSFETISQPGTLPLGKKLRAIIKEDFVTLSNTAMALLMMAARDEVVSYIEARLSAPNHWFFLDRHCLSTEVYQLGNGVSSTFLEIAVKQLHFEFDSRINPALTFVLDIPADVAVENIKAKGVNEMFDAKSKLFFENARQRYRDLKGPFPHYVLLDANKSIKEIAEDCLKILSETPLAPVNPLAQPLRPYPNKA